MRSKVLMLTLLGTLSAAPAMAQTEAGWRTPDPDNVLVIETNKGRIIAELTPVTGPTNVERIKTLAHAKFYDGLTFFRVIDDFMAQTGDPDNNGTGQSQLPDLKGEFVFRRGAETPFTRISTIDRRLGFAGPVAASSQADAMMDMTVDHKVNATGLFCPGTLGMARSGQPDSANSQFFIMTGYQSSLNNNYTILGRVLIGLDVAKAIKMGEPVPPPQDVMKTVRLLSDIPLAQRPKVRVRDTASPEYLAYVERIKAAKGANFNICDLDIQASVQ